MNARLEQLGDDTRPHAFYWDRFYACVVYPLEKKWEFRSESKKPEFWVVADHEFSIGQRLLPAFNAKGLVEYALVATWRADPGSFWVFDGWRTLAPGCE